MKNDDLQRSMICLSESSGTSLFEKILTEDDLYNGLVLDIAIENQDTFCFSIINEYQIDTINDGRPFTWAKTFYNIDDDLIIRRFDHPVMQEHYKEQSVFLSIKNTPRLEKLIHASHATLSFWKQNNDEIWTQANTWPGEDLFIVLKAWNDPKYRYIYFDENEIPILKATPARISDVTSLDWKFLHSDLTATKVKLPFTKPLHGTISGINKFTGNKCILFDSRGDTTKLIRSDFDLFLPNGRINELKADLTWWHNSFEYNYRIRHGIDLSLPTFDQELFIPLTFNLDSVTLSMRLNPFPEYFRIIYRKNNGSQLGIGKYMHQHFDSYWIVIGENNGEINFTLPDISDPSLAAFPSLAEDLGPWWYSKSNNIKVLENDPKIEWINYFHDYNVLLVSYRDPFKQEPYRN